MNSRDQEQIEHPLEQHFRRHGFDFELADGGRTLSSQFGIDRQTDATLPLWARFESDSELLLVQVGLELAVPQPRLTDAGDLANRLNAEMSFGNYEVLQHNGSVGFRVSTFVPGGAPLSEHLAKLVVGASLRAAHRGRKVFANFIDHGMPAKLAYAARHANETNN